MTSSEVFRVLRVMTVTCVLLTELATGAVFEMSVIQQQGIATQFATTDKMTCFNACSGNVSAVSFSKYLNLCMLNMCANIKLFANALWTTLVCVQPVVVGCDYPVPMIEWMMTDACGFANTGYVNPGWLMYQAYNMIPTKWTSMYDDSVNTNYFGRVVRYPNLKNYQSITVPSQVTLDPRKSLTFFGFIKLYTAAIFFPILEFGRIGSNGQYDYNGLIFWIFGGGIYYSYDVTSFGGSGVNHYIWSYNPPVNQWIHLAVAYNSFSQSFQIFVNGSRVWTSGLATFTKSTNRSVAVTGSRPQDFGGLLPGSTYCLKVFQAALTESQVNAVAQSCIHGAIAYL